MRRTAHLTVLLVALSLPVALAGPAAAQPELTELVSVEGTIQIAVVDDFAADADQGLDVRALVTVDGIQYDLPATPSPDLRTGDAVEVRLRAEVGLTDAEALEAASDPDASASASVVAVEPAPTTPAATSPLAARTAQARASVLGAHTLLVLPVYWGYPDSATRASLATMAASTATYWSEQSGGRLTVTTTVRDWALIPDHSGCDADQLFADALAAAGVAEPTARTHVVVYFPETPTCGGWAGMASITGGQIWINGTQTPDVLAHEFGHNLGLGHANTATCTAGGTRVSLSATCSAVEYADRADVMGSGTTGAVTGNLNTAFADYLGMATVIPVPALPATIELAPLAEVNAGRAVSLATAHGTVYVDFRPNQGRDVRKPLWAGVQVHRVTFDAWNTPTTELLDMQPTTGTAFTYPALPKGSSWLVPGAGALTVTELSTTTATISLTAAPVAPPVTGPPAITRVSPGAGATTGGTTVTVTGSGFTSASQVTFGGIAAASVSFRSAGTLVATTASHARGSANVAVSTAAGTSPAAAAAAFRFQDYVGLTPVRAVSADGVRPGAVRCVPIAGTHGVPAAATSVAVNVTTVGPSGPGFVVVYPDTAGNAMTPAPAGSTVNFDPGADVANSAFVQLPPSGRICYSTRGAGSAGILVDVIGFTVTGSGIATQSSVRLLDTRNGTAHVGPITGPLAPRTPTAVQVTGAAGVPANATGVLLNVTVTGAQAPGNLRVYPDGAAVPTASVVNYAPGKDKANASIVALPANGRIRLYSDTDAGGRTNPVNVILDVVGYTVAGSSYRPLTPTRVLDTRPGIVVGPLTGPLRAKTVYSVPLAGTSGGAVPTGAAAVILNVTAIGPSALGNLRVYPDSDGTTTTGPPAASSINYIARADTPNLVVVSIPADGRVNFYSDQAPGGTVQLAVDVLGYIAGS